MPLSPQEQEELNQLEQQLKPPSQVVNNSLQDYLTGKAKIPGGRGIVTGKEGMKEGLASLSSPESLDFQSKLSQEAPSALAASFVPEGTANPLSFIARKTGLNQIPDRLMQKAVGLKKYIPGIGNQLLDEGVVGTKGMMQGQVEKGIEREGENLNTAVKSIKGNIDSLPVAQQVAEQGKQFATASGMVPQAVEAESNKVLNTASDIASRGQVSPEDALKLKRIAGSIGYKNGDPLTKLNSQLARTESSGYGKGLEEAYASSMPEGAPNAVSQANQKLSSFLTAKRGLSKPDTLSSGNLLKDMLYGAAGASVGGVPGAGIGVATGKVLSTPIGQSVAAQGLSKTGKVLGSRLPLAAVSNANAHQSALSPDEEAELQQLSQDLNQK